MNNLAKSIMEKTQMTDSLSIEGTNGVPYGVVNLPGFTVSDLRVLLANLDSVIYLAEMVQSKNMEVFVGLKISLLLVHT